MDKVNLLIIASNLQRAGYKQRIGVYLDILAAHGIHCKQVQLPENLLARYRVFRQAKSFDGVLLHKKGLNLLDAFLLKKYAKKVIYHFDDAIMYNPKNPEKESGSHSRPFYRSVKLANRVITCSSYLAEHARRRNSSVFILPSGLNIAEYCSKGMDKPGDGKIRLVWIGSLSTLSYLEAIKPALEELGRRNKNLILRIICDDFFDLENMEVEKRRWTRETRVRDLAECDIGLAPLPDNRFTRGKGTFKILEYASVGLPVIAAPVGVHAEYIQNGTTGFLAESESDWISRILLLAENSTLRKKMGDANLAQAKKFDLSVLGNEFAVLIRQCFQV